MLRSAGWRVPRMVRARGPRAATTTSVSRSRDRTMIGRKADSNRPELTSLGPLQMAQNLLDCHPSSVRVGNGRRLRRRVESEVWVCDRVRAVVGLLLLSGLLFGGVQTVASAPEAQ